LVLLVEFDARVLLEQRGESDRGLPGKLSGDTGIEQSHGVETVVAVEDAKVVVGVMKDFLDIGVAQERADRCQVRDGERIDQRRLAGTRDLEEINPVAVAMEARRLRVDGGPWLAAHGA